ncbi:MAG: hypothetical protein ACKN83_12470 [Vulcanococcus sp.]
MHRPLRLARFARLKRLSAALILTVAGEASWILPPTSVLQF